MPSTSPKQARFMAAIAHDPAFAARVGVPQKVGKDFNAADKGTGIIQSVNKRKPVLRIGRQSYGNDPGPGNI